MRTVLWVAGALIPVMAFGAGPSGAGAWSWHGPLGPGQAVEVRGITGDIHASPSDSGDAEIFALIERERGSDAVDIRALETSGGVTICAVRKGQETCGADGPSNPGARVDYQVRLPAGVHLKAHTVNGEIRAHSLSGDVNAATVNGAVTVSTSGSVQVHTVNGSIDAALLKPFWSKAPEFSAVNGKIMVSIPTRVSSDVRAETRNGKVVADMPDFHGKSTEQSIQGHIGAGGCGNSLVIRAINGTIELRQKF